MRTTMATISSFSRVVMTLQERTISWKLEKILHLASFLNYLGTLHSKDTGYSLSTSILIYMTLDASISTLHFRSLYHSFCRDSCVREMINGQPTVEVIVLMN